MQDLNPYTPIDCSYYDQIEHLATLTRPVHIVYKDHSDRSHELRAKIMDTLIRNSEEFIVLDNQMRIRMDKIVSLNGILRPRSGDARSC